MHQLKKGNGIIPEIDPEAVEGIKRKLLNIPYASDSPTQKLDIYYPDEKQETIYPVIIYFHGGGFEIGQKNDEDLEPMLCVLERGYVLISVDYRLSGEARFPAALYDAKAAVRFVKANADKYHLDESRIGLWGPSAGGWIVSMLAVTTGNPAFEDLSMGNSGSDTVVQAVVDWCGPCAGFDKMDEMAEQIGMEVKRSHLDAQSPESKFLGAPLTRVKELCRMANPVTYVTPFVPPFLIVHGTGDEAVPYLQSEIFANAINRAAGEERAALCLEQGKPHHGTQWYTERWVVDMCLDFFDRQLKR